MRLDDAHRRDWSGHETSLYFERVLKAVRDEKMPPPDAKQPGAADRQAAVDALHNVLMVRSGSSRTGLRRLNRYEYENTVESVFGIDFQVPRGFPKDHIAHGFDNSAQGLVMSGPLMEAYLHSAIDIADRMIPPPRKPVPSVVSMVKPDEMVISYSSGAVIDGSMRLATRTNTVFRSCTWPEKFEVRTPGKYRITVTASRYAPPTAAWPEYDEPMQLEVRARSLNESGGRPVSKQRLLADFKVTEESPTEFEFTATLHQAETPLLYFANAPVTGDRGKNRGADGSFAGVLRKMFGHDPRLLAGWLKVKHGRGLRGGTGWKRVKKIRDSDDLDLDDVDMSQKAVEALIKKMTRDPRQYAESVVYQFFEEGPCLAIHDIEIEGPLTVIQTKEEKQQAQRTRRFLGAQGEQSDEEFVSAFLERFLTRAFRRPAKRAEVAEYAGIVSRHVEAGHSLKEGLHLAVRTALVSPRFLYRGRRPMPSSGATSRAGLTGTNTGSRSTSAAGSAEEPADSGGEPDGRESDGKEPDSGPAPGTRASERLDNFDLATRLGYFLTGGPPDQSLFAAAESGTLTEPDILEKQTRRLLKSRELDRFVSDFTSQWLGTRRLPDIMPDARLFPEFTPKHREAMVQETELFFTEILQKNLPLETFIKPDFTFLNQRLAKSIYGRKGVGKKKQKFVRVALSPESPYGGLLGQAGIMMATGNGVDTQPVVRGVWVLENILGNPPPPPPESVPALTPDTRNAKTVRELLAAHRSDSSCATCHRRIDPLGFVLENFDAVGRWRTHYPVYATDDAGQPVVKEGAPVDATARFPGGVEFEDVNDLKQHVVSNIDDFSQCLSQKLLTYATGNPVSYADRQELSPIVDSVRREGNGFRDLLIALVRSEAFRTW